MSRSNHKSRLVRTVMLEALQTRELMAADASLMIDRLPSADVKEATAEQWAVRILDAYDNPLWLPGSSDPLKDLKEFASEQEAQKYLTDAFLKTWQDVLGKPVDNKLNYWLWDVPVFNGVVQTFDMMSTATLTASSKSTNNQVFSVDEADQFEVSSRGFIYTVGSDENGLSRHVSVFDAHNPKNLLKVATIDIQGFSTQMHLVGDQLILVSSDSQFNLRSGVSHIQVYSVSDPSKPTLQTSLTVSGAMQQSRFVDGKLIFFGNQSLAALRPLFISDNPSANYAALTETPIGRFETAEEYAARIEPLVIGWMLPDVKIDGSDVDLNSSDWKDLVAGTNGDYHHQVSVISFGLTETGLQFIDSESLIGASMATSYVDNDTVYVANPTSGLENPELTIPGTQIFAINFDADKVDFLASGVVLGSIRDSRMMDEYQGNLRVFSDVRSWSSDSFRVHASANLYILRPNAGKLEEISSLYDVADGQALYSANFNEDQAMITTWVSEIPNQWTMINPADPLHGFDLSDPMNPVELSELVIPGVSTYLQRIDATHLVGIGYIDVGSGNWRQQVSLYDVSDLANLKVVDTWTSPLPMGWSINFNGWNQNSLAVNFDPQSGLFSFASAAFGSFANAGLTVFKIDTTDEIPLQFLGYVGDQKAIALRSAIVGDTLFVISNYWLSSYGIDDLFTELDRELLMTPGAADWASVRENESVPIDVLINDHVTHGRVTSVSSSKIGGKITILGDGAAINYEAPDIEGSFAEDQLTYIVELEDGETYSSSITVSVYASPNPVDSEPILIDPIILEPIDAPGEPTEVVQKAVANKFDVSGDGEVSPLDLRMLLDNLNLQSARIVAGENPARLTATTSIMDLSGDGELSPIDLLLLVDQLNSNAAMLASGEESVDPTKTPFVDETLATDVALLSLMASNYSGQDDILVRSKKSSIRG